MARGVLTLDLDAVVANWRALAALSGGAETAAVVKADAYGLGAAHVAPALMRAGARSFFVALTEEGAALRDLLGPEPEIYVLSGHMAGDAGLLGAKSLIPFLNSPSQIARHRQALPSHPFGVQFDTGMNRLGLSGKEWEGLAPHLLPLAPKLLLSHLACGDEPDHPLNEVQLTEFRRLTDGLGIRQSFAATAGILLGPAYRFALTRPGIGLYAGAPFSEGRAAVSLSLPVIQTHEVEPFEFVGYGATHLVWRKGRIATVAAGYADGLSRALAPKGRLWSRGVACAILGRVSMDIIAVDVSHLDHEPEWLDALCPEQGIEALAAQRGTIGYEVLTSLGPRYARRVIGGEA